MYLQISAVSGTPWPPTSQTSAVGFDLFFDEVCKSPETDFRTAGFTFVALTIYPLFVPSVNAALKFRAQLLKGC